MGLHGREVAARLSLPVDYKHRQITIRTVMDTDTTYSVRDSVSFVAFLTTWGNYTYRVFANVTRNIYPNPPEYEEFLSYLFEKWVDFRQDSSVRAWLKWKALGFRRDIIWGREVEGPYEKWGEVDVSVEDNFNDPYLLDLLVKALAKLPDRQLSLLSRYYYDGISLSQLGVEYGVSKTMIIKRLRACIKELRTILCPELVEESINLDWNYGRYVNRKNRKVGR